MAKLTRRTVLAMLGTGGGLFALGYALRSIVGAPPTDGFSNVGTSETTGPGMGGGMMGPGMMGPGMGGMSSGDMSTYMDMFNRHGELRRRVEDIPGGVRTTTESDSPDLAGQLKAHVSAMYSHVDEGAEVMCMSDSLPTLFRRASDYQRRLTFTDKGVVAEETAGDPDLTQAIRAHAREVTGFVTDGMPAMMRGMMGMGG
ncbi:MAG: hypothetical protein ACRDU5_16180 [Mycobacterium sp.]